MKKYFNILTAEASATADVSGKMFIRTLAGLILCLPLIALMVAPTISFAAVVDDSFDDGDIASNSLGAGTGFTTFTQDDGLDPSFVTEVGGVAILGTGPHCDFCISAIASKDSFDFFGSRASWEISGTDFLGQSRNYLVVVGEDFATFDQRLNPGDTQAPGVYIRLEDNEFPFGSAPGFVGGLLVEDGTGAFDELATWNWSGIWDREGPLEVVLGLDEIGFELTVEGNLGQTNLSGVWANISSAVGFTTAWNTRDAVVGAQNQGLNGIGSMTVDRITASTTNGAELVHRYELEGNLLDTFGGSSLVSNGTGFLENGGYRVPEYGSGLSLTGAIPLDEYTIELAFSIDLELDPTNCANGPNVCAKKLVDYNDRADDDGFYAVDGPFNGISGLSAFFPPVNEDIQGVDLIPAAELTHMLITRDAAQNVDVIVNGSLVLSFQDVADDVRFQNDVAHFLMSDFGFLDDAPTGFIDRISVWGGALTAEEGQAVFEQYSSTLPRPEHAQPFAYVTNQGSNNVSVINTETNTANATVTVGSNPSVVAITPDAAFAYVTNQASNNVSVINTETNTVDATVTVGSTPFGVAIKADGAFAYVTNQGSNNVSVISTETNTVDATVTVGSNPIGVAITPDGAFAYVTNLISNSASVINTETNTVDATVTVGSSPIGVAITPDGAFAYVTNRGSNNVSVINTETNTVDATVTVGSNPLGVAITPDAAVTPVASYLFKSDFSDELGGPDIVPNGGILQDNGYAFGPGQGLSLTNVLNPTNYSIEMLFRVDSTTGVSVTAKLIDFANLTSDVGWYTGDAPETGDNAKLGFFTFNPPGFYLGPGPVFENNTIAHMVVTRSGVTGEVKGYVNGVEQLSFTDLFGEAIFAEPGAIANFFLDDGTEFEVSGGFVDFINIYNTPLSASAVEELISDSDGDGEPDFWDNCPTVHNPDQEQTGNNIGGKFGDACVDPSVIIPPNADVDPTATVGPNTIINKGVTVGPGASVGSGVTLNKDVKVGADATIESGVTLEKGVFIGPGVVIGANSIIGKDTVFCAASGVGASSNIGKNNFFTSVWPGNTTLGGINGAAPDPKSCP